MEQNYQPTIQQLRADLEAAPLTAEVVWERDYGDWIGEVKDAVIERLREKEEEQMAEYRVLWEIDVDADSPEEAALQARAAQARVGTTATVFTVMGQVRQAGGPDEGPIFERIGDFDVRDGRALTIEEADALDDAEDGVDLLGQPIPKGWRMDHRDYWLWRQLRPGDADDDFFTGPLNCHGFVDHERRRVYARHSCHAEAFDKAESRR